MKETNYMINDQLFGSYLERMNFLNEISIDYPDAVSFGSGRPDSRFFSVKDIVSGFLEAGEGDDFFDGLGQYNKTKGIINETLSRLLRNDEDIHADPGNIILTDGAQEGMVIVINTLFDLSSGDDVLLVSDPSYIGFVGYAKILGVPIVTVKRDGDSIDLNHLEETLSRLRKEGKNPKVLYEVPDFHNPTGEYMPLEKRKRLIELAEKFNFFIVEDNPYGYFRYDAEKVPTLKALDGYRRVIYLGSFSKTLFPSIRLGYLVADQVIDHNGRRVELVEELKKTKSFTTVNTSTLLQAMAGRYLEQQDFTMVPACGPKVASCRKNRDTMLEALAEHFSGINGVKWNRPKGGFFMTVDLPFAMTDELLKQCVEEYSVIVCPMSFFCLDEAAAAHQIRLAFSTRTPKEIHEGIKRLSNFVKNQSA